MKWKNIQKENKMREEIYKKYVQQIQEISNENKIEYTKELLFNIEMIDAWDEKDKIAYDVLCEILRKLQIGVINL